MSSTAVKVERVFSQEQLKNTFKNVKQARKYVGGEKISDHDYRCLMWMASQKYNGVYPMYELVNDVVKFQEKPKEYMLNQLPVYCNQGMDMHDKKPFTVMFAGPSGVGKTETAKCIANIFTCGESLNFVSCNKFTKEINISRMEGPESGYIGFKEKDKNQGYITEWIQKSESTTKFIRKALGEKAAQWTAPLVSVYIV